MTVELTPATSPSYIEVLHQAATAFQARANQRPDAVAVSEALLQAEKATKQARQAYLFESLLGDWQLCFTTGTRKVQRGGIVPGKGFYLPKLAVAAISFSAETDADAALGKGTIGNQVEVGPVRLRFTGPAHYLGKKNLLAFDFTHLQVSVLGRTAYSGVVPTRKSKSQDFYRESIAKLPFFAFFLITPALIAARGRGGGLALWVRSPSR